MNPQESLELMRLIRWLRDEFALTILLVEHNMKVVMGICETVQVIDYGETIAVGTPARDPEEPARSSRPIWAAAEAAALEVRCCTLENVNVFYGAIHALRDVSLTVERRRGRDADRRQRRRQVDDAARHHGAADAAERARSSSRARTSPALPAHKLVARGISMAPEGRGIFANLTVHENLEMGAYLVSRHGTDQAATSSAASRSFRG